MKVFKTVQTKDLDRYTIENEPISSYDLMKRAVSRLFDFILPQIKTEQKFVLFAGPGNNGGDALVLARLLHLTSLPVEVYLFHKGKLSADCQQAKEDAEKIGIKIKENETDIEIKSTSIIIDGLFGAGLSRPLEGIFAEAVNFINQSKADVLSIDIPSGLFGEDNTNNYANPIVKAKKTYTFQQPKIAFFFAENEPYIGEWSVIDISLHPIAIQETPSTFFYTESSQINLKNRRRFSHKGTFGHALLVAGKYGMAGAAVLSSKSALRMGIGLLSIHIPSQLYEILQISVPEAIIDLDNNDSYCSHIDSKKARYSAIGMGPGLGTTEETASAIATLFKGKDLPPIVIDADALNIISQNKELLKTVPQNTIITPHPKEFDRIAGPSNSSYERLEKGIQLAKDYNIIVIIKGANTSVILPNGEVHFNSTGNAGMATAGSGDVLTGIILSLLAQHYPAKEAAIYGVYLHGLAGDIAAQELSEDAVVASDIIAYLPKVIKQIRRL